MHQDKADNGEVKKRVGVHLTPDQAVDIYGLKLAMTFPRRLPSCFDSGVRGKSVPVAAQYGVSPKAIRDIWNRKAWAYATAHLWSQEEPGTGDIEREESAVLTVRISLVKTCST